MRIRIGILLFLAILTEGCAYPNDNIPMQTGTIIAEQKLSITLTRPTIPTLTPILLVSYTPHFSTPQSTTVLTPTPDEQTRERIWHKIMTTLLCPLSCWWGITPGVTTWSEAQNILNPLMIYPDTYPVANGKIKHDSTFHFFSANLYNNIELIENDNVIETINVSGEGLSNTEGFSNLWKAYTPGNILTKYGIPFRITLQTWKNTVQPSDSSYKYYDLSLFYDQLGFVVLYRGRIENKPNYSVCPTYSGNLLEEIYIYTQSANNKIPLENLIGENYGPPESAYRFQDATGFTMQEFYNHLINPGESRCFNTSSNIWPP